MYHTGLKGRLAQYAVTKYRGHRGLPSGWDSEEFERKYFDIYKENVNNEQDHDIKITEKMRKDFWNKQKKYLKKRKEMRAAARRAGRSGRSASSTADAPATFLRVSGRGRLSKVSRALMGSK